MTLPFRLGLSFQLRLLFRRFWLHFPTARIPNAPSPTARRRIGVAFGALHTHHNQHDLPPPLPELSAAATPRTPLQEPRPWPHDRARDEPRSPPPPPQEEREPQLEKAPYTWPIHELMRSPVLFDPVCAPRNPIVLCHGLYGFDVRGPASFPRLQMHYWSNVLQILRERVGARVLVPAVPSTGSIQSRAEALDKFLQTKANGMDINFMAHSMGGLDCRHLISNVRVNEREYTPRSLMTVSTPHQGSPFMDWCLANIGIGASRIPQRPFPRPTGLPYSLKNPLLERKLHPTPSDASSSHPGSSTTSSASSQSSASSSSSQASVSGLLSVAALAALPSSFTTLLLGLIDSPAYSNLTTHFMQDIFNPATPDLEGVKYYSVGGRISGVSILHPLWLPKVILDAACARAEGGNDGLVSVSSARWGEFLGVLEECDHWDMRGARGLSAGVENLLEVFKDNSSKDKVASSLATQRFDEYLPTSFPHDFEDAFDEKDTSQPQRDSEQSGEEVRAALRESGRRVRDGPAEQDAEVRSTTDRLSSVFDWIAEHVPLGSKEKDTRSAAARASDAKRSDVASKDRKSDLSSKEDLERLYVALCRKLYDEGL